MTSSIFKIIQLILVLILICQFKSITANNISKLKSFDKLETTSNDLLNNNDRILIAKRSLDDDNEELNLTDEQQQVKNYLLLKFLLKNSPSNKNNNNLNVAKKSWKLPMKSLAWYEANSVQSSAPQAMYEELSELLKKNKF